MPFMDDPMLDLFGEENVGDDLVSAIPREAESPALILHVDQQHNSACRK